MRSITFFVFLCSMVCSIALAQQKMFFEQKSLQDKEQSTSKVKSQPVISNELGDLRDLKDLKELPDLKKPKKPKKLKKLRKLKGLK